MGNQNLFGSKRKGLLKNKIFYIFLAGLLAFGWWINQPMDEQQDKDDIIANAETPVKNEKPDVSSTSAIGDDNKNVVSGESSAYYLLKAIDDEINLYYYDETGKEKLLRVTDIAFSLISENDQEEFKKGIIVNTEEELNQLLEDFES